ncbi:MAG: DUF4864 domain-containing protein [Thalassobaculaceae bacterium]|nr:DUF4864 domain-containing protein [Thalassobaculaceae bacterium]
MTRTAVPIPILIPRIAAAVVALFVLTAPAAAQTAEEAAAFRGVISAQVDAFRADAWDRAFSYASPSIHALFGSSEQFRSMVMGDYVAVARPQVFEFEEATTLNGHPTQPVFVVGPDGIARRALYFMEQQPDGSWKIDGVVLETLPDRTS